MLKPMLAESSGLTVSSLELDTGFHLRSLELRLENNLIPHLEDS